MSTEAASFSSLPPLFDWQQLTKSEECKTIEYGHHFWDQSTSKFSDFLYNKIIDFVKQERKRHKEYNTNEKITDLYNQIETRLDNRADDFELVSGGASVTDKNLKDKLHTLFINWFKPSHVNISKRMQSGTKMVDAYNNKMRDADEHLIITEQEREKLLSGIPTINFSEQAEINVRNAVEQFNAQSEKLNAELTSKKNQLASVTKEKALQETQLTQIETKHQEQLSASQTELQAYKAQIQKLKQELKTNEADHKRKKQKICEESSKQLQSIAAANDKLQIQFSALLKTFDELDQEKQELVRDLQAANAQGNSLSAQITLEKQQSKATRQELEKMDIAHKLSLESKEQEIKQLKYEVEQLNHEKDKLTKQARPPITVRSSFNDEKGQVHDNYEKVLLNNKKLKAEVAQLKEQLKEQLTHSKVNNSKTATTPIPKPRSRTTDETANLSAEVTRLEAENEKLKAQIQTSSQLDVSAPSMNANIEQAWRQLEKENKEYKDKVKKLETSLEESQKYAAEVVANFQKRVAQLEKENKELEESSNSTPKEILKESSGSASKEALALSKYPTVPDGSRIPADAKPDLSILFNYASELTDKERSFELNWENLANVLNAKTGSNINHREIAINTEADYGRLSTFLTEWSEQDKATNLILAQSLFDCLEAKHSELADEFYINIRTGKDSLRSK